MVTTQRNVRDFHIQHDLKLCKYIDTPYAEEHLQKQMSTTTYANEL